MHCACEFHIHPRSHPLRVDCQCLPEESLFCQTVAFAAKQTIVRTVLAKLPQGVLPGNVFPDFQLTQAHAGPEQAGVGGEYESVNRHSIWLWCVLRTCLDDGCWLGGGWILLPHRAEIPEVDVSFSPTYCQRVAVGGEGSAERSSSQCGLLLPTQASNLLL